MRRLILIFTVSLFLTAKAQVPAMVKIPGGEFDMGDHFGFVDPNHPSDELPIHKVWVDSFYIATYVTTNQQFLTYLNSALSKGLIEVRSNIVYAKGGTDIYYYTNQYASYYSIGYNGTVFSIADFRANHPVVGVMWYGSVAYCNWLSTTYNLKPCYNLTTWACDSTAEGYRLPYEAEWEFAGRGGHTNPYNNYPWGNDVDKTKANWPGSGDPYEGTSEAAYPYTTPVGFYDGKLHLKSEYNWPGSATSYQTSNGVNSYGLYDMAGNVWQLVNDWYGQNYYSLSPYKNPKGPAVGFTMPDGKQYHGMRGGNWYNGDIVSGVDDGHSRVSNRNPSYYRGPQDPNHPWYHVGFRIARNPGGKPVPTGINSSKSIAPAGVNLFQNFPNPFFQSSTIKFSIPSDGHVNLKVFDIVGVEIKTLADENMSTGIHEITINKNDLKCGVLFYRLQFNDIVLVKRMLLIN